MDKQKQQFIQTMYQKDKLLILSPREQAILKWHYGLEGQPHTLNQVGKRFEVSGSRIGQIERIAISKLLIHWKDCKI